MPGLPVLIGCCGWPEARAKYFSHFQAVEVQATFYEPPSCDLARRWRAQAPPGFLFALKAWQLITHRASSPTYRRMRTPLPEASRAACGSFRPTGEVRRAWETTLAFARALEAAVIVFQCPASFEPAQENIDNLVRFFGGIEREGRLLVWEPRGDWRPDLVKSLCDELGLVHCVDPFVARPVAGAAVYFRLHGRGGYRYQYSAEELLELGRLCDEYHRERRSPIYVMFNNTPMRDDALRFRSLLEFDAGPAGPRG